MTEPVLILRTDAVFATVTDTLGILTFRSTDHGAVTVQMPVHALQRLVSQAQREIERAPTGAN
jgi:hypothetical protein